MQLLNREHGSGGRLCTYKLLVRLHSASSAGCRERAAADDPRNAHRFDMIFGSWQSRRKERAARRDDAKQHPRLDHRRGGRSASAARSAPAISPGASTSPGTTSRESERACQAVEKRTTAEARRDAHCPTRGRRHRFLTRPMMSCPVRCRCCRCDDMTARSSVKIRPRRAANSVFPESGSKQPFPPGLAPRQPRGPRRIMDSNNDLQVPRPSRVAYLISIRMK